MTTDAAALRVLSQALKLEQEGRAFYLRAIEETLDDRGKALFRSLADDERIHAETIQRQLQSLESETAFMAVPDLSVPDIDLNAKLFPPEQSKLEAKVGINPSEVDALQVALENEIRSYDLYRAAAQQTSDAAGKQMYQWLAGAEISHFNLLMANYEAIISGSGWVS
jgi:rubrerythrin